MRQAVLRKPPTRAMLPNMEEWRPVTGWEGLYEVSDQGRVRSTRGYLMKLTTNERGYLRVGLSNGRIGLRQKHPKVHRIVFHAFHGWIPKELNHKDLDKTNNQLSNLEPSNRQHNQAHAKINGRYNRPRKERPTKTCEQCGAIFSQPRRGGTSDPKRWQAARFCSWRCYVDDVRS